MATSNPLVMVTPRDHEIFRALDCCPLTVEQLLKVSQTFAAPFHDVRRVRERMQALAAAGRVRRFVYATAGRGATNYYTLSALGYRLLHGHEARLPSAGVFQAIGIARQEHCRRLADFLVHTFVALHHAGVTLTDFHRENALRLVVGEESLYPDSAFHLRTQDGAELGFLIELDNCTERVNSPTNTDSWDRKIRLYEQFQNQSPRRFRVLAVTTGSTERLSHILDRARALATNPKRQLVYGTTLRQYLAEPQRVTSPIFRNHRGEPVAMVQAYRRAVAEPTSQVASPAGLAVPCFS